MASPGGDFTHSNLTTGGNARVHAGNNYNSMTTAPPSFVRPERGFR
jgi:hypothetical protein